MTKADYPVSLESLVMEVAAIDGSCALVAISVIGRLPRRSGSRHQRLVDAGALPAWAALSTARKMRGLLFAVACLLPFDVSAQSVYRYSSRSGTGSASQGDPLRLFERKLADAAKCDATISTCVVTAINGVIAQALGAKLGEILSTPEAAVPASGDAQPFLQAALNAVAPVSGGNGVLRLSGRQYPIIAADLVTPADTFILCDAGGRGVRPTLDYRAVPCTLMLAADRTVRLSSRSGLLNVSVINANLPAPPTNMRSGINYIAGYSGTGIKVQGDDVRIQGNFILGFGQCISNVGYARLQAIDVAGDCLSGIQNDQNHDIVRISNMHFWPFGLVGVPWGFVPFTVTGSANNGAGLIRLTLAAPSSYPSGSAYVAAGSPTLMTGDVINFSQAVGLPRSVRTRWPVTVVDSAHVDLQGSTYPSAFTFTAAAVSGSPTITTSSVHGLGVGMMVTMPGFPADTKVTLISDTRVTLSASATATATGVSASASPVSDTATAYIDLTARPGIAFEFTNGERNECVSCFDFGYQTGVHLGVGAGWTHLAGYGSDHEETEDGATAGILITDSAYDSIISDPWVSGKGISLIVASSAGPAHKITNGSFNAGSSLPAIQLLSGDTILTSSTLTAEPNFGPTSAYVTQAIHSAIWSNNNLGSAPILYQDNTLPSRFSAGNIFGKTP